MIQAIQHFAEQYPGLNWLVIVASAVLSWLAPIAALVTIGCALLQAYISWQKYRHWKRTNGGIK